MAFDTDKFENLIKNSGEDVSFDYFEQIDSTNVYAKTADLKNSFFNVIISSCQTNGKGRMGRSFISKKDTGIYFSVIVNGFEYEYISLLTVISAVCVIKALEKETGEDFKVKWVNDILYKDKKICGILVENVINPEKTAPERTVIGIGVNLFGKIDDEISSTASTVEDMTGKKVSPENLILLTLFYMKYYFSNPDNKEYLSFYKNKCVTLNNNILVNDFVNKYSAYALDIDDEGRLKIEKNGRIIYLNSGEASVLSENMIQENRYEKH